MVKKVQFFTFLGLLLLSSARSYAASPGAAFLKIGVGARSLGMASAFTAVADDVSAIYWNPAGISGVARRQLMVTHSQWIENMNFDYAGYVGKAPFGNFGIGITYLSQGTFEGRNEDRSSSSNFSASDLAIALSASRQTGFGDIGANLKFINQSIESENAFGVAVDLGWKYQLSRSPMEFGFAVLNIGYQMKFINESYDLPLMVSGGAAYRVADNFRIALDVRQGIFSGNTNVSMGTEYWIHNIVALRAGYLFHLVSYTNESSSSQIENLVGLGAGFGTRISNYQIDYALVPNAEFGSTHRLSLSTSF